jgi:hypothetical protein
VVVVGVPPGSLGLAMLVWRGAGWQVMVALKALETCVSLEQTQRAIDRYFGIMGRGGDFADCYTKDVTWITSDTGERIDGPNSVRDYIVALHANMVDMQTRRFRVGDGSVYLEGDCADTLTRTSNRICYCVAYDMKDDLICPNALLRTDSSIYIVNEPGHEKSAVRPNCRQQTIVSGT